MVQNSIFNNPKLKPFVKWAGGKRRSIPHLVKYFPHELPKNYVEPFVGGGAMYFAIGKSFEHCLINDVNLELMNAYGQIRDRPDELMAGLQQCVYEREFYEVMRSKDRDPKFYENNTPVERAVRFIYLLKTCYNGLYRVNSKNHFNVPFGKYTNVVICEEDNLRACHDYLNTVPTEICAEDFRNLQVPDDSFVYIDPPYVRVEDTSFTSYQAGSFNNHVQRELKLWCDELDRRGIYFMASNSDAPIVYDLYGDYNIHTLTVPRFIGAKNDSRRGVTELCITNYDKFKEYRLD